MVNNDYWLDSNRISIGGWFCLWVTDRRTKDIRRLLGKHQYGTSDPAIWDQSLLANLKSPNILFGTLRFSSAVMPLLKEGRLSSAMWAARLAVALESKTCGEKLTNDVFADVQVKIALHKIRRHPSCWKEFVSLSDPVLN